MKQQPNTLDVVMETELGQKLLLEMSTWRGKLEPENSIFGGKAPNFPCVWAIIPNGYPAEAVPITKFKKKKRKRKDTPFDQFQYFLTSLELTCRIRTKKTWNKERIECQSGKNLELWGSILVWQKKVAENRVKWGEKQVAWKLRILKEWYIDYWRV